MKLRTLCGRRTYVNDSKSEDSSDNQSNKSAVLGLFTHEKEEELLKARTGKGHSISCSTLVSRPKPDDRSCRCGGGDPHARGVRRSRPIEMVGKNFTEKPTWKERGSRKQI